MKIVIDGAGEVGSHLAKMLSLEANDITVIDSDPARLERINSEADVITFQGPPSSIKVMKEAQVQRADLFISVVPNVPQDVNIVSAREQAVVQADGHRAHVPSREAGCRRNRGYA